MLGASLQLCWLSLGWGYTLSLGEWLNIKDFLEERLRHKSEEECLWRDVAGSLESSDLRSRENPETMK